MPDDGTVSGMVLPHCLACGKRVRPGPLASLLKLGHVTEDGRFVTSLGMDDERCLTCSPECLLALLGRLGIAVGP